MFTKNKLIGSVVLLGASVLLWICFLPFPFGASFLRPPEVRFVLPEAFHGAFVIVLADDGDELEQVDGVHFVVVNPSRVVRVRTFEPFASMHKESWTTVDNPSAVHMVNFLAEDEVTALRCLGFQSCGAKMDREKYFMGTRHEAEAFDFCAIDVGDWVGKETP